jgi:hypothetical protein
MVKGFDPRCGAGKTACVWLRGKGGGLKPGQALVLLPLKSGENQNSPAGYLGPLREALIEKNKRHVNVVVCEADYRALKRASAIWGRDCNDRQGPADLSSIWVIAEVPRQDIAVASG